MNVLFPFVGDTVGGSHISALDLIEALPAAGVQPHIVLHRGGRLAEFLSDRSIGYALLDDAPPVDAARITGQLCRMARLALPLANTLRQRRVDIVHTNDARMHLSWGLATRLARRRFVWHQRSADDSRRNALYSRLADEIVTISHYCKDKFAPPMCGRARVIYDPFDTLADPPDRRSSRAALIDTWQGGETARFVGFVGNLTDQKRPAVFVDMAARLAATDETLRFPLFGELREPLRTALADRINAYGLGGKCRLMGPRHPIEPAIAACEVLVAPAVNEGLGRTLVEAMLVGTPVVAAAHGGHCEVIENDRTGRLAASDDPAALADAVAQLLVSPRSMRTMADAARIEACARFSRTRHVDAVTALYRELVP